MRFTRVGLILVALAASACAPSTRLTAIWKDPQMAPPISFKKVLVVAQTKDQAVRRSIEDHLATKIPNATPSYRVLTEEEAQSQDHGRSKLAQAGYDGAVVVRFARVEKQTTYVPGTTWWGPAPYGTMWGYWGYGWGMAYDPGYIQRDTVVALESNVYDVSKDKLVWASRSETVNPESAQQLVDSVLDANVKEMKKQKVL
ncbi:MAG TPA: hypothetical protein VH583_04830 [Vicinamibacterales bacterium]|jgi:hypothetical protein